MKKVFKIFLIAISLIFCITALTSCGLVFNMKNTGVLSANFVKNDIYFTNADGEKISVTDKGDIIAEDRISKDIFREVSSDE